METTITQKEVAEMLNVSISTLQKWRHLKKGPQYYKPANRIIYHKEDIIKYTNSKVFNPEGI